MGRRKRKKKRLIILIIVMLLMTVAAAGYILHRGTELSGERAETVKDAVIEDLQETRICMADMKLRITCTLTAVQKARSSIHSRRMMLLLRRDRIISIRIS